VCVCIRVCVCRRSHRHAVYYTTCKHVSVSVGVCLVRDFVDVYACVCMCVCNLFTFVLEHACMWAVTLICGVQDIVQTCIYLNFGVWLTV